MYNLLTYAFYKRYFILQIIQYASLFYSFSANSNVYYVSLNVALNYLEKKVENKQIHK